MSFSGPTSSVKSWMLSTQLLHPRTARQRRTGLTALFPSQPASAREFLRWLTSLSSVSHLSPYDIPAADISSSRGDASGYSGSSSSMHVQACEHPHPQAMLCGVPRPLRRDSLASRYDSLLAKPHHLGPCSFASGAVDAPAPKRGFATESAMDIFDRYAAVYSTFPIY